MVFVLLILLTTTTAFAGEIYYLGKQDFVHTQHIDFYSGNQSTFDVETWDTKEYFGDPIEPWEYITLDCPGTYWTRIRVFSEKEQSIVLSTNYSLKKSIVYNAGISRKPLTVVGEGLGSKIGALEYALGTDKIPVLQGVNHIIIQNTCETIYGPPAVIGSMEHWENMINVFYLTLSIVFSIALTASFLALTAFLSTGRKMFIGMVLYTIQTSSVYFFMIEGRIHLPEFMQVFNTVEYLCIVGSGLYGGLYIFVKDAFDEFDGRLRNWIPIIIVAASMVLAMINCSPRIHLLIPIVGMIWWGLRLYKEIQKKNPVAYLLALITTPVIISLTYTFFTMVGFFPYSTFGFTILAISSSFEFIGISIAIGLKMKYEFTSFQSKVKQNRKNDLLQEMKEAKDDSHKGIMENLIIDNGQPLKVWTTRGSIRRHPDHHFQYFVIGDREVSAISDELIGGALRGFLITMLERVKDTGIRSDELSNISKKLVAHYKKISEILDPKLIVVIQEDQQIHWSASEGANIEGFANNSASVDLSHARQGEFILGHQLRIPFTFDRRDEARPFSHVD